MNKKRKTVLIVFILAALVITACFIVGIRTSGYHTYAYTFNSEGPTEEVDLFKFRKAEGDITFLGDICGITMGGFNCNGAYSGDEAIRFIVRDSETGTEMLCYDYPLRDHQYDDARVFIPFTYHADEDTTWHIEARCINITREHPVTVSLSDGELYLASVHRDDLRDIVRPVIYYIASLLILGFAAYLYFVRKMPLTNGEKDNPPRIAKSSLKKIVTGMVILNLVFAMVFVLVYSDSGRYIQEKENEFAAALCDCEEVSSTSGITMRNSVIMLLSPDLDRSTDISYEIKDNLSGRTLDEGTVSPKDLITAGSRFEGLDNLTRIEETGLKEHLVLELNLKAMSRSLDGDGTCTLSLTQQGQDIHIRAYDFTNRRNVINLLLTMLVISMLLADTLYLINNIRPIGTAATYLIAALVLGFVMSILIPSICVPDERYHMNNCYAMSNSIMGIEDIEQPSRILKRVTEQDSSEAPTAEVRAAKYNDIYYGLMQKTEETEYTPVYGNTGRVTNAPVVCYLPGAIGITIARLMGLNGVTTMLFARLMTLIAVTLLIYVAVRKMPFAKAAMACCALIPMSLQEIASTSYDGFIIAMAFIFTAYSLFLIAKPDRRSVLDWTVTLASAVVLSLCKGGVYIPLLGLIVLIEFSFEKRPKGKLLKAGAILGLCLPVALAALIKLIPVITKTMRSTTSHSGMVGGLTNVYTAGYLLRHKSGFLALIARTLSAKGEVYLQSFIGGRLGLSVYVPGIVMFAFIIILLLAAMRKDSLGKGFSRGSRIYLASVCLIGFALIFASMLFASTPTDSSILLGIQGRYFIPFLPLILVLTRSKRLVFKDTNDNSFILAISICEVAEIAFAICSILILPGFW